MKSALLVASLLALCVSNTFAEPRHYQLDPAESRVTFTGHSALHSFSGDTSEMEAEMRADMGTGQLLDKPLVRLAAMSLKTGIEARDHAAQYTLKAEKFPTITFQTSQASPLKGELTIGGVTRTVAIETTVEPREDGVHIEGRATLALSGFSLKPPPLARWLGLRDEVEVRFDTLWREIRG